MCHIDIGGYKVGVLHRLLIEYILLYQFGYEKQFISQHVENNRYHMNHD